MRRTLGVGLVALALTGCGSTFQVSSTGTATGQHGLGQAGTASSELGGPADSTSRLPRNDAMSTTAEGPAAPNPSTPPSSTEGPAAPNPSTPPSSTDDQADTSPTPPPASGGDGATDTGSPGDAAGAGGTAEPLTIGVITSGNAGGFVGSFGIDANFGDQREQAQVLADHLNAQGGIVGRQISLVYYDYDAGASAEINAQAACTAFTEDHDAFAAIGVAGMSDTYHECAKQRGMVVLSDGDLKAASFFQRYPTTFVISDIDLTRKYAAMVNALHEQGFFTPRARIGLLYVDERNDIEGIEDGMKPALAQLGLTVEAEVGLDDKDTSDYAAALSSSVLQFRSKGITHVIFGRASAALWAQSAASQEYYPYLGIDSRQSPGLLMQDFNSSRSLEKAYGIGYQPVQDVDAERDPGFLNSNHRLCKKLLDDAGQGWGSNRLASGTALYLCDQLFFLSTALEGQPEATPAALLNGVAALGTSYQSPLTFSTAFSATRHDGADAYRLLRYNSDCSCFEYVSPSQPFPA